MSIVLLAKESLVRGEVSILKTWLSEPQNVVITTHQKPDADALGSSLGFALFLEKMGHVVQVITPTDYPEFLQWMPGNDKVWASSQENQAKIEDSIKQSSLIFCLDFNGLRRINE